MMLAPLTAAVADILAESFLNLWVRTLADL
jgi:hypothetical protein